MSRIDGARPRLDSSYGTPSHVISDRCLVLATLAAEPVDRPCVLVVVGTPGTPEYAEPVPPVGRPVAGRRREGQGRVDPDRPRRPGRRPRDRDRLKAALAEKATGAEPLWIVLIGHGTFDGNEAKFNLRGPDVTDAELSTWLAPIKRPVAVLDCASASGPFLNRLSGREPGRHHGDQERHELNFARFGQYLAEAIADPGADLDKDGQVSLLEAFLTASSRTAEFYRTRSRLATEHALLDDNGDQLGTPADWFHGVRATRRAKDGAAPDGLRAHQLHAHPQRPRAGHPRRGPPEAKPARAGHRRPPRPEAKLAEDEYYAQLEPLMIELARLYRDLPD